MEKSTFLHEMLNIGSIFSFGKHSKEDQNAKSDSDCDDIGQFDQFTILVLECAFRKTAN